MYNRPYRGYKKNRNRLIRLTLLIFIVFVLLFVALGFLFVQNYLVFTPNGVKVVLPFQPSDNKPSDSLKEPELEIVNGNTPKDETANPSQPAVSTPDKKPNTALRSVSVPASKLNDITYRNNIIDLYNKGIINSVNVEIKTKSGLLNYNTEIAWAKDLKLSTDSASYFKDGISALKTAGITVIGEISCFDDNTITKQLPEMAVKTKKGVTWLDYSSKRHLNPYNEKAAEYLSGIIKESAEMGFSEVILTNFRFPPKGMLKLLSFGEQPLDKSGILAKRLSDFKAAAGNMGVSVYIDEPLAKNGNNDTTGMNISAFYPLAYRVYAPLSKQSADGEAALMAAVTAVAGGDKAKVVPVCTNADYIKAVIKEASPTSNYLFDLSNSDYSLDNLVP